MPTKNRKMTPESKKRYGFPIDKLVKEAAELRNYATHLDRTGEPVGAILFRNEAYRMANGMARWIDPNSEIGFI